MHSCTFDTAFVFLNIFIVLYILGEMTIYAWRGKKVVFYHLKAAFYDLGSLRLYRLYQCFYKEVCFSLLGVLGSLNTLYYYSVETNRFQLT